MRVDSPRAQLVGEIAGVPVDGMDGSRARLESVVEEVGEPRVIAEREDPVDAELLVETGDHRPPGQEAGAVRAHPGETPARSWVGGQQDHLAEAHGAERGRSGKPYAPRARTIVPSRLGAVRPCAAPAAATPRGARGSSRSARSAPAMWRARRGRGRGTRSGSGRPGPRRAANPGPANRAPPVRRRGPVEQAFACRILHI